MANTRVCFIANPLLSRSYLFTQQNVWNQLTTEDQRIISDDIDVDHFGNSSELMMYEEGQTWLFLAGLLVHKFLSAKFTILQSWGELIIEKPNKCRPSKLMNNVKEAPKRTRAKRYRTDSVSLLTNNVIKLDIRWSVTPQAKLLSSFSIPNVVLYDFCCCVIISFHLVIFSCSSSVN